MIKLNDVIDIIQRRARFFIKNDNISQIYVKLDEKESKARIIIILNDNPDPTTLTSIALHYINLFEDVSEKYTFEVLGSVNNFRMNNATYLIWRNNAGFIGINTLQ